MTRMKYSEARTARLEKWRDLRGCSFGFCCCLSTVLAPSPPRSCHYEVSNP